MLQEQMKHFGQGWLGSEKSVLAVEMSVWGIQCVFNQLVTEITSIYTLQYLLDEMEYLWFACNTIMPVVNVKVFRWIFNVFKIMMWTKTIGKITWNNIYFLLFRPALPGCQAKVPFTWRKRRSDNSRCQICQRGLCYISALYNCHSRIQSALWSSPNGSWESAWVREGDWKEWGASEAAGARGQLSFVVWFGWFEKEPFHCTWIPP